MSAANLINKLMEIERVLGKAETAALRKLVHEAQSCVLEMQRQLIDTLGENARLRERMETCTPSSPARTIRELRLPTHAEIARELVRAPKPPLEEVEPVRLLSVS